MKVKHMSVTLSVERCRYTLEMEICVCSRVCALAARWESMILQQEGSQALKNRHKPYKGPFRPQQCYSTNQPHLHCSSSSSSRTAQRHHLYSAFLLSTVRERNENQTPDNSFLFVYSICHVATHHWEAPSSFLKSGF